MTELDTVIVSMVSKLDAINQKVQLASGRSLEFPQFFGGIGALSRIRP